MRTVNFNFDSKPDIAYNEVFEFYNGAFEEYFIKVEPNKDIKISCDLCKMETICNDVNASLCCGDGYFDYPTQSQKIISEKNIDNVLHFNLNDFVGACKKYNINPDDFICEILNI